MKREVLIGVVVVVIIASLLAYTYIQMLPKGAVTPTSTQTTSSPITQTTPIQAANYNFVLFITDPPLTFPNITAIYLKYGNVLIHKLETDAWISLNQSSEIELMGLVNLTQVISVAKLPQGNYNLIRFTNASAQVTYEGQNYTAKLPSNELLVRIEPPLNLTNSTQGVLIDLIPRVLINGEANATFMLVPFAKAYIVSDVNEILQNKNVEDVFKHKIKLSLKESKIFNELVKLYRFHKLEILNVTISQDGFNITVQNVSNETIYLKLIFIRGISSILPIQPQQMIPRFMFEIFQVLPNGTITPVVNATYKEILNILENSTGFELKAGQKVTLVYKGALNFEYLTKRYDGKISKEIIEFQRKAIYIVTIIGVPLVYATQVVIVNK
ncbi:MAG: DUF4382 domain-containing protein [Thermoproteota archaeon]|jgi:hypothetical protein|nr:DUF4382 domain-containing protein [Thermoproteota archaeon]